MNILVLEDEPLVAGSLIKLVTQLEPEANITGPIASIAEATKILEQTQPDLILSDIQLADGISLDIFTAGNTRCPIIFTTAYDEYAIRAFKVNSIDYLLKPVDKQDLQLALEKYHTLMARSDNNQVYMEVLNDFFKDFRNTKKYKERFTVHHGRNIILVAADDVACFAKEEVIYLVHKDGKKYITDFRSLDEIEEILAPEKFYRANRQYIVSLPYIDSLRSDESGKVLVKMKLQSSPEIVVSKERASSFRKWIEG